jgi:hypothetical protein
MKKAGGKVPSVCEGKYTSNVKALRILEEYIKTKED